MTSIKLLRRIACMLMLWTVGAVTVHADGLPGEYVLGERLRNMIAHHIPLTNPALMTEENYLSLNLAFTPVLNGEFKHFTTGLVVPIGLYQSFGVMAVGQLSGKVYEGTFNPDGTILVNDASSKSSEDYTFIGSYAWNFWNRLSAGANVNAAYQHLFDSTNLEVSLDFGFTYRLMHHAVFGDHVLGVATHNLIPVIVGSNPFSSDIKFTWLGYFWERQLEGAIDVDIKDLTSDTSVFKSDLGTLNAAKEMEWHLNFKAGAWLLRMFKVYALAGMDQDMTDYVGMALGFNLPTVNRGRDLEFFVQYNKMLDSASEASTVTFSLRTDIGKHREEMYARRMARLASLSPNELYNRARKLYSEKKYWDAFFVFSRIVVEYPDFFKSDWVQLYRSNCEEELDMRNVAIENYEAAIKEFPLSSAVPYANLGLMRIHYRNGDPAKVANEFVELNKPNVPDSLRYHGAYLMGQMQLQGNEPAKAIQVLSTIPETHPDYAFAQHAIAIALVRSGGEDMAPVVAALENAVSVKAETPTLKEIVARSYLFLGYIFYEENTLSKAVVALRMVPSNSFYSEDALLGQGWTALKARQWTDCISTGQLLTRGTKKNILKCEGMLIQAYGHLLQKEYVPSLALLKEADNLARSITVAADDTLNYARMQYESNRMSFNFLAEKVENISKSGQSSAIARQTDSLHTEQTTFVNGFREYYDFTDEFHRTAFFTRSVDQVREDIDYALATVQKILGQSGVEKTQQKMGDKQKDIDQEIQKLQQEMEKLQKENN